MDKRIFFLAGLPRSGSTLLSAILSQNPQIHVTATSPLLELLVAFNETVNRLSLQYTFDAVAFGDKLYRATVREFFANITKPVIVDKHRGWHNPKYMLAAECYLNATPRIIATIRPIAEVLASYLKLIQDDPSNFVDRALSEKKLPLTNEARAYYLWTERLQPTYGNLQQCLQQYRERLLLVDYNHLTAFPAETLSRVYAFLGLDSYQHDLLQIINQQPENKDGSLGAVHEDNYKLNIGWGLKGLHEVRSTLERTSTPLTYFVSQQVADYFKTFDIVN